MGGSSLGCLVYHNHCMAGLHYSDRDFCGLTLVTQASWNDEQLFYVFKTYIFSTALYIFPYKFLIYQLRLGRLCVRMVLNRGFYWNHLGSWKMPTGSHHQLVILIYLDWGIACAWGFWKASWWFSCATKVDDYWSKSGISFKDVLGPDCSRTIDYESGQQKSLCPKNSPFPLTARKPLAW